MSNQNSKDKDMDSFTQISLQVHRVGHQFREAIVDEARASLNQLRPSKPTSALHNNPEPIPKDQAEYDAQVDAALRELFPRIPNTDRQEIIAHAFTKVGDPRSGIL